MGFSGWCLDKLYYYSLSILYVEGCFEFLFFCIRFSNNSHLKSRTEVLFHLELQAYMDYR